MKHMKKFVGLITVLVISMSTLIGCNTEDIGMKPYTFGDVIVNIPKEYEIDDSDEGGYGFKGRYPYVRFVDPKDNTNNITIFYEEGRLDIDEEEIDLTGLDIEIVSSKKYQTDGVDTWLFRTKQENDNGTLYFYSLNFYFSDKRTTVKTETYDSKIDEELMTTIINNVKVVDNGDSKEIEPTATPEPTKSPEALYAENMEKVEMYVETGNYSAAVEILEGINTPEAQKAIDGINAIDYVNQVIEKLSEDWMLSGTLAGIDVSFDYDPMTYTFYQTFVMSEIYDIAYSFADEDSSYINDDTAKNLYYDYFYSEGYTGMICTAIVRNSSNEFLAEVTYGGDDSPAPTPTPVPTREPGSIPFDHYRFASIYSLSIPLPTEFKDVTQDYNEKVVYSTPTTIITGFEVDNPDRSPVTEDDFYPTETEYSELTHDYFNETVFSEFESPVATIIKSKLSYNDTNNNRMYEYDIIVYPINHNYNTRDYSTNINIISSDEYYGDFLLEYMEYNMGMVW